MSEITGDARLYSAGALVSSAVSIVGKELKSGQYDKITVASSGVAIANDVEINAQIVASAGGSASRTTVGSNGALHIYSGGSVRDTRVKQSGYLGIGDGAFASNTYIDYAGALTVWSGGVVNSNTIDTYGAIILSSGAVAEYSVINSGGGLHVYSGAVASNTTVNQGGFFGVGLGATTYNTSVGYGGALTVWGGGVVNDNVIDTYGAIILSSGAVANSSIINSDGGLHVYSGAQAYNTTVKQGGFFGVGLGATTYNTSVGFGGALTVWSGGVVNSNTIDTYGAIILLTGAKANSTTVLANGGLHIYDGAVAENTIIDEGATLGVGLGGYLGQVVQKQNSTLTLYEGAMLGGINSFAGSISVTGGVNATGSVIELNLCNRLPETTRCIDNIDMIYGASYKVVADKSQAAGTYTLSSNAGAFDQSVMVVLGNTQSNISVGETIVIGMLQFALYKSGADLCFSVSHLETPNYVEFYNNGILVQSVPSAAGWTIGAGQTANFVDAAGGSISNFTVLAEGTVALSLGGSADTITVNGGYFETTRSARATNVTVQNGFAVAASSGTVSQVTVNSGSLIAEEGGRALRNSVQTGGWIVASSHGYAEDSVVGNGGYAEVKGAGTFNRTTLNNLGVMFVGKGGVASDTTVTSGATMRLYQDGRANGVVLQEKGALLEVDCGASVDNLTFSAGAAGLTAELGSGTNIRGNSAGAAFEIADGKASGLDWKGNVINVSSGIDLFLNLQSGGLVDASVLSAGHIQVSAGGAANNNQLHYFAQLNVSSGGSATGNSVDSEAEIYVFGGRLSNTTVNQDGYVWIASEGIAEHTTVNSGGRFDVGSDGGNGGLASDTTVLSGGYFQVISGTSSTATRVCNGGTMVVDTGKANDIRMETGAGLYVKYTGVVSDVTMDGGTIKLFRAGKVASVTVNAGEVHATSDYDPDERNLEKDRQKFISSAALYRDGAVIQSAAMKGGAMFLSAGAEVESLQMTGGLTYLLGGRISQLEQSSGSVAVSSGAVDAWTMSGSGCYGEVQNTVISSLKLQGTLVVKSGAGVDIAQTLGDASLYISGGNVNSWTVGSGRYCEMSGGTLGSAAVAGDGVLIISAGSITTPLQMTDGQVHLRGGRISQLKQTGGGAFASSGAIDAWTMTDGCYGEILGGVVSSVAVSGTGALHMNGGKVTSLSQGATHTDLHINGGTVTSLSAGKYLDISSAAIGTLNHKQQAGNLLIQSGTTVDSLVQGTGNNVTVTAAAITDWTIGSGCYDVVNGGSIGNCSVGGTLEIKQATDFGSAKVTGSGILALNAASTLTGSLEFDLTGVSSRTSVMVQNLDKNGCGTTAYSIALSSGQASGTYSLASGAAAFDKSVSITVGTTNIGTVNVGGNFAYGSINGTLFLDTNELKLDLSNSSYSSPLSEMFPESVSASFGGDLLEFENGEELHSAASESFTDMLDFDADPGAGSLAGSLLAGPAGSLFGNETEKTVSPLFAFA